MTKKNFSIWICNVGSYRRISRAIETWLFRHEFLVSTNNHNDPDLKQELGIIPYTACYSFTTVTTTIRYTFVTVESTLFSLVYPYIVRILACRSRHAIAWSWDRTCHKIFLALHRPCFRILRIHLFQEFYS